MDNVNTGPVNPEPNKPNPDDSKPGDMARHGPTDPATGQPDHGAEVTAVKGWFRENAVSLVITIAVIVAVCVWLDPWDTFKVVVGLGFIIFIHELGHFLAAKWCDVHVRTFSIGFGPAVPFCSYKWGETTYMIGIIPLGGYVAMVGENEGAEGEEEGEEDPRSFRKKSVWQRMLIISAGVIMNIIFGMACFVAAYLHGVQEKPATVAYVESGGPAWRSGMRTGDHITKLGGRENPWFDDIRPKVMSSSKDEALEIEWDRKGPDGKDQHFVGTVTPVRDESQRFPQIGVSPPSQLVLQSGNKRKVRATFPGTPAADAVGANGEKFEPGDRIVAMSDPKKPKPEKAEEARAITEVKEFEEYYKRMVLLSKEPIAFQVQRKNSDVVANITVKPAFRHDLGMRMRMGEVVALRKDGAAEKAKIVARSESENVRGDRIKAVMLPEANGRQTWYVAGPVEDKPEFQIPGVDPKKMKDYVKDNVDVKPLDPLLLPMKLNEWADRFPANDTLPQLELVLTRAAHPTDQIVRVKMPFDKSFRYDRESALGTNSPLPLSGLGLAYWVEAVADDVTADGPAKAAGIQPGDVIIAVRFKAVDEAGNLKTGEWKDDLKVHQWASVDTVYQLNSGELDLKVKRVKDEVVEINGVKGKPDTEHALDDRGLILTAEVQVQRAADIGEAVKLGALRTGRFIKTVYMNLYGYLNGRISVKTLSGPLTIADVSYKLAGEDFWQFLLFLGMISVNLAVVNFLPVPVLDGGHMVFLIYEKVTGKPVPERLFAILMYIGLFMILALMLFVLSRDVGRLFLGWL